MAPLFSTEAIHILRPILLFIMKCARFGLDNIKESEQLRKRQNVPDHFNKVRAHIEAFTGSHNKMIRIYRALFIAKKTKWYLLYSKILNEL